MVNFKFKKRIAKAIMPFAVASSLGLSGCATTNSALQNEIGYEKFYDSHGDYKLVGRNNDIWIEKLDGSESMQITHTPNVKEDFAIFSKSGNYIAYTEDKNRRYITKSGSNDSTKKEISQEELLTIIEERYR